MRSADAARGKWRGILLALGVDQKFLQRNKHGPCPMCEGRDRYRWDDKDGSGSFICSQCGAGDGFGLLMKLKGWNFTAAAKEVDAIVGNVPAEAIKPKQDDTERKFMLNRLWGSADRLRAGDMASNYLMGRGVLPDAVPTELRFAKTCPVPGGKTAPAMLAMVRSAEGQPVNIHRTFLGPNGKADLETPRAMMPGEHPDGSAVRLAPVVDGKLGIAEGIETALAASRRFGVPVWAALNAGQLAKWNPPAEVQEVFVFGDCDASFTGQAAAFSLAYRLKCKLRIGVHVHIPDEIGRDWADYGAA